MTFKLNLYTLKNFILFESQNIPMYFIYFNKCINNGFVNVCFFDLEVWMKSLRNCREMDQISKHKSLGFLFQPKNKNFIV